MSIQFEKKDQETIKNIAGQFIKFYYDSLTAKQFDAIGNNIKHFTIISFEKNNYEGPGIGQLYKKFNDMNMQFYVKDFATLHSGARRINILVTGVIRFLENGQQMERGFTEYIHLATGKNSEFWIQMSIFKLI